MYCCLQAHTHTHMRCCLALLHFMHFTQPLSIALCMQTCTKHLHSELQDREQRVLLSDNCQGHALKRHCNSSRYSLGYWVKSLPTDVTLAAQKPLVLPVTDRARLKKLPHTIARNVLPMTHLMTCGMENLQPFQHLHECLPSRSAYPA